VECSGSCSGSLPGPLQPLPMMGWNDWVITPLWTRHPDMNGTKLKVHVWKVRVYCFHSTLIKFPDIVLQETEGSFLNSSSSLLIKCGQLYEEAKGKLSQGLLARIITKGKVKQGKVNWESCYFHLPKYYPLPSLCFLLTRLSPFFVGKFSPMGTLPRAIKYQNTWSVLTSNL